MLNLTTHRLSLLLFCFSLLLCSCTELPPPRFVWPPPPDQPRMEFIGNYYSEADFEKSQGQKIFAQITGSGGEAFFSGPFGVASKGDGIVYVSDIYLNNVRVFDFNKKTVNFLTKTSVMNRPLGMDLDNQGNLYIANAGLAKILVYGPDHQPRYAIGKETELLKPAYVAVNDSLGRLYVSDGSGHKIVVFSLSGEYLFSFGGAGGDPGQFFAPQGLAFGPDGNLYVADMLNARIQILTPSGEFVRMFGERGDQPGQFENPKDLAFDSDGNLHVIEGRRSDLVTYTPEGKLLLVTGGGKATFESFGFGAPRAIAIDASDRIYIAENTSKRFSIWQYMSSAWQAKHPFTEADKKRLNDFTHKIDATGEVK